MPSAEKDPRLYPADLKIITSVETLRVVADPLRLRLLALLRRAPATAKELAGGLDTPLKGLYYHLAILEEHELIRVHATRVVSGIIEKQYAVTAYRLSVDRALFNPEPTEGAGLEVFLSFVLDHARAEILRSVAAGLIAPRAPTPEDGEGGLSLGRLWLRLTPAQREELERRVKALHLEYADQQAAPDNPAAQYYEVLVGTYPVIAPPDGGQEPKP
ncbi:MAG TPA: helix-turn-helix domain-containing protein [Chloroflexaceae bacterium]|nr:helix-turn-helix domain-containing protein [Chloroflexaceae bacterium]